MASEAILDKHTNLEVGEVLMRIATPGVTPGPATPPVETKHSELLEWIQKELKAAENDHVNKWREETRACYRFVAGDQYDPETRRMLRLNKRPDTAFNTLQKYLRYASGLERRAPQALLFNPVVIDDVTQQLLGEYLTTTYEWAVGRCDGNFERSRAFQDLMTGGLGWTDTYLDKLRDPQGLIQLTRLSPFEMLWPDCAEDNLRTTRWRARESLIHVDDAIRRWPEHESLIRSAGTGAESGFPEKDVVQYTVPYIETVPLDRGQAQPDKRNKVKVAQFQWYEDQEGWAFPDPVNGESMWMSEKDFRIYKRRVAIIAPDLPLKAERAPHRVYQVVYVLERKHLLSEPKRLPDDRFSLNVMSAQFDEDQRLWYGFVRVLMDPQRYGNKFFNQAIEIIATTAKGGAMAQSDAFSNTQQQHDFEDTYARPGSVNIVAPESLEKNKIKPKEPGQIPAAAMAMLEFCIKSMDNVTGLNTANPNGGGGGQMPGITQRQRQQAELVLLAVEFDALARYRKDEGRTIAAHLALLADGRLVRVGGQGVAAKVIPLLRQPYLLDYDLQLDDTEHDPTLRQVYTNFIIQAGPMLAKQGLFVPSMFNYLPFPVRIRQEIIQAMQQAQQQQAEAAAKGINLKGRGTPRDPRETQARIEKLQSDALLHTARAKALSSQGRREDLRAVVDAIQGFTTHGLERDRHDLDRARHGLERDRHGLERHQHGLERHRVSVDTITQLLEALRPQPGTEAA